MQDKTKEKLRKWTEELGKLDEVTRKKEAEIWCLLALIILEEDNDFQVYCKERKINA